MLIKVNTSNCICLKNTHKRCTKQCIYSIYTNNCCKRHQKKTFRTVNDHNLVIIQSYIRAFLVQKLIYRLYGPIYKNPILSHDNIDPISLEKIWEVVDNNKINVCEIPRYLIFSYKDENNHIRVFNILSLLKIAEFDKKHPVTRNNINSNIFNIIKQRMVFMKERNLWNGPLIQCEDLTIKRYIANLITDITLFLSAENIYITNNLILDIPSFKLKQLQNECRSILYHSDNIEFTSKFNKPYFTNNLINFQPKDVFEDMHELIKIVTTNTNTNTTTNMTQYKLRLSHIFMGALMYVSPDIYNLFNISVDLLNS